MITITLQRLGVLPGGRGKLLTTASAICSSPRLTWETATAPTICWSSRSTSRAATATDDESVVQNVELCSAAARPGKVLLWRGGQDRPRGVAAPSRRARWRRYRGSLRTGEGPAARGGHRWSQPGLAKGERTQHRRLCLSACRGQIPTHFTCVTTHFG